MLTQYEIRVFADAIGSLVKDRYRMSGKPFKIIGLAVPFLRQELEVVQAWIQGKSPSLKISRFPSENGLLCVSDLVVQQDLKGNRL